MVLVSRGRTTNEQVYRKKKDVSLLFRWLKLTLSFAFRSQENFEEATIRFRETVVTTVATPCADLIIRGELTRHA